MAAGNYLITLEVGAGWTKTLTLRRNGALLDTTDWTGSLQIKDVSSGTVLLDLRTGSGGTPNTSITMGGPSGTIVLFIDHAVIESINWNLADYDFFATAPNAQPKKYLFGKVKVISR